MIFIFVCSKKRLFSSGIGVVALQVKPPPMTPAIQDKQQVEPWPLYFQSGSRVMHLGKVAEDGPTAWTPATHTGDPDGAPGPRLQPGPALTFPAILSFCFSNK